MKLKALIVSFMIAFTGIVNAQTATEILTKAQNQAKVENKNVFLIFHASWCGWCKKMEKNMDDPAVKPYFDANYVKTFITVQERAEKKNLETPGGDAINEKLGGKNQRSFYLEKEIIHKKIRSMDGFFFIVLKHEKLLPSFYIVL